MTFGLRTFRSKVACLGLTTVIVSALALGYASFEEKREIIERNARHWLSTLAGHSAKNLAGWLDSRKSDIRALTGNASLRAQCRRLINTTDADDHFLALYRLTQQTELLASAYGWVTEVRISDPTTGEILVSSLAGGLEGTALSTGDLEQLANGETVVTPVFGSTIAIPDEMGDPRKGVPTMLMSAPIEGEGQVEGILSLRVDVGRLGDKLLRETELVNESSSGSIDLYLVDAHGVFLSPSAFEQQLLDSGRLETRSTLELDLRLPRGRGFTRSFEGCRAVLSGQDSAPLIDMVPYPDYRGVSVVGAWAPVSNTDWFVIAEIDHSDMVAPLNEAMATTVVIALMIAGGVGILAVFVSRILVAPLAQLTRAAGRITEGDRSVRCRVDSRDEVGQLAAAFNEMAETIEQLVAGLESAVHERTADLRKKNAMLAGLVEEVARSSQTKSEFLANMSHEIRTPMTAILGFTEDLLDPNLSGMDKLDAIHTIRRNGEHLLQIINDILDVAKIESGRLEVECIRCSPVQVTSDVATLMRVCADEKKLTLGIEFLGVIPETIHSDPTRLKQILVNLIGNAVRFTEKGGVRVLVRFVEKTTRLTSTGARSDTAAADALPGKSPDMPSESHLQFDVIDTGIGMTQTEIAKLFRAFTQADSSTTRKFGGTGLGLVISKSLAEELGGTLTVESVPNEGSSFRVTIAVGSLDGVKMLENPIEETAENSETTPKPQPEQTKLDCRILLAEDGLDNQRLIARLLTRAGARVAVAANGKLAVAAAIEARDNGAPFDVILMDMQMPIMDGYEATGRLRENGYTGPIIALTAHAMKGDRERCIEAGCDDYASKPINRTKLIATILHNLQPANATS